MAETLNPIPEGMHTITPHLTVDGASDYIDFLKRAFGAVELHRSSGPGGKIMHATVRIGDSWLMLNDYFPEFGAKPMPSDPLPFVLHLQVNDADALFAQAAGAGCTVTMPIGDQFWGDRYGQLRDPRGFGWSIAMRKENVSAEEMLLRQKTLFGGS